jgi:glucarate dehydratase
MRITGVSWHKVNIPFEAPLLWSGGVSRAWTRVIVRMRTDEGIEGIAETVGWDATIVQLEALKDFFIGEDPFDREKILKNFWYVPTYQGMSGKYAIQALETCCWDIMGKAVDRPLCQLLGGKLRTRIPTIAYIFYRERTPDGRAGERTAEEIVEHTRELVETHGFRTLKMKGGVYDPDEEYRTTAALREAFPDHKLRFDPNSLWTVETGLRVGRKLQELDLEWCEDLVWGLEGMSRLRKDLQVPFATNMCCVQLDQLAPAIRMGAIDVQLLDVHDWSGITATMKAAATCQTFQIGTGFHSGGEAGISTALYLQLSAAFPTLPYAIDSHYHHQTEDVITQPFEYVDGCFDLPDGPGLGVEIDEDRLAHLEKRNAQDGDLVFYGDLETRAEPRYMGMW